MNSIQDLWDWWNTKSKIVTKQVSAPRSLLKLERLETREVPAVFAAPVTGAKNLPASVTSPPTADASTYWRFYVDEMKFAPEQDFERRYSAYTKAEKLQIVSHVRTAWSKIRPDATSIERVAAINAYVYQYLIRTEKSGDRRAVDILRNRGAVCGGMVLTMAEMLYAAGYRSQYAYLVGGAAAHSMLEVSYANGLKQLFDPYHGIAYFQPGTQRPVSLAGMDKYVQSKQSPAVFAQRGNFRDAAQAVVIPISSLAKGYSSQPVKPRTDYTFPGIFTRSRASGVANSGRATVIGIDLAPGQTIGVTVWKPSANEPTPWSRLSVWRDTPTTYLSWAYVLGESSLGYKVQHDLKLKRLSVGRSYTIKYFVVNAYGGKNGVSSLSMRLEGQNGNTSSVLETSVVQSGYRRDTTVTPQVITFSFTATNSEMRFRLSGAGDFVMMGIQLQ